MPDEQKLFRKFPNALSPRLGGQRFHAENNEGTN